ncbi:hypothetical protein O3P69_001853 [Scylla paramamosain]|uniref:Uncharacterized protein n=1 Tax=Scylla paramamosain TaxID=85552 RepID=A0AAW0V419_SCYPA
MLRRRDVDLKHAVHQERGLQSAGRSVGQSREGRVVERRASHQSALPASAPTGDNFSPTVTPSAISVHATPVPASDTN